MGRGSPEALSDATVVASCGVVHGLSRFGGAEAHDSSHDPVARKARHGVGSPPWLIGHSSNMAVRRSSFVALGGFDERFGPGSRGGFVCEDADLIVRLLGSGIVVAGTGEPVLHIDWRSPAETRRTLVAYERGSGAWIGKLLRAETAERDAFSPAPRQHAAGASSLPFGSAGSSTHGAVVERRIRPRSCVRCSSSAMGASNGSYTSPTAIRAAVHSPWC